MTPAQAIGQLDRQIARHGETVALRKAASTSPAGDAALRAFVRGYKPEELSGGIQQGDSTVILSPRLLEASGFDGRPKRLDKITIAGRLRNIEVANPVMLDGEMVRLELWVKG